MELVSLELTGYRRFRKRTTLQINGKLVAILGPNEAGKSTLLQALLDTQDDEPIAQEKISRGSSPEDVKISAKFLATQEECKKAGLAFPTWLTINKYEVGDRRYEVTPRPPLRETSHRAKLRTSVEKMSSLDEFRNLADSDPSFKKLIDSSISALSQVNETLSNKEKSNIQNLATYLENLEDESFRFSQVIAQEIREVLELEAASTPHVEAINALTPFLPAILMFGREDRLLKSSYGISEFESEAPPALRGLCEIAEIDLNEIAEAMSNNREAELTTFEHRANNKLREHFSASWSQSTVHTSFRFSQNRLHIQIVDKESTFTTLDERSDGLRQFVALQSFVMRSSSDYPILLIDELEQRLHYDAQADLVQMLASQNASPKVIYSTHSAGCLPEDLGNGVRLVRFSESVETESEVINKFWDSNETGLSPLLFGMGANTLAFFPTRKAVVVEGPSDMLLLPLMMQEALSTDRLGFQFVPGLANLVQPMMDIDKHGRTNVIYLVDGDEAGDKLKSQLQEGGIAEERVIQLRTTNKVAVELEDFLQSDLLLDALDYCLKIFHQKEPIDRSIIGNAQRTKNLEAAYFTACGEKIPKVTIAYYILDCKAHNPSLILLDKSRKKSFIKIAKTIRHDHFKLN